MPSSTIAAPLLVHRDVRGQYQVVRAGEPLPAEPAETLREACERRAAVLRNEAMTRSFVAIVLWFRPRRLAAGRANRRLAVSRASPSWRAS